jgi:hypothetical protein
MNQFVWGMLSMGAWVAGLFFWRFWRDSHDRLFAFFAFAFWVLALHWITLGIANPGVESRHYVFLLRLIAFVLIVMGIVDKNRRGTAS